ncbi:MAG: archease [Archaeoglobales archaeon]|jgi:SHS2 domain-containing protein|nr:archease [Archaeoglobus sp.]NHW89046.1 archease [Archaeoglobales archaeon]
MKYRFIDHTADIAFEVYGNSLEELLENSAYAFYEAFVKVDAIKEAETRTVEVEADEEDLLLYRWLNELLFLFETQFFAGKKVKVRIKNMKAEGTIVGSKFGREAVKVEPKAITMHKFGIRRENGKLAAFIVVDI